MAKFGEKLKAIRLERNLTQDALANLLGTSKQVISRYENSQRSPKVDVVQKYAEALNVPIEYLLDNSARIPLTIPPEAIPYRSTGMAPILGAIPAGYPLAEAEIIEGYEPIDYNNPEEYYWLRVSGDSMVGAKIYSGDLALIHMQDYAEGGDIVACRVNGDEATLKRFKQQGDTVLLLPENPDFEPYIVPVSEFENGYASILGVLVETRRKFN